MRALPFVFTAVALVCGSAIADPTSEEKGGEAANLKRTITTQELQEMAGAYKLSNGRTLHLVSLDDRLYGELNGGDRFELLATSDNTFSSRDGAISVVYDPKQEVDEIRLNYNNDLTAADSRMRAGRDWRTKGIQR